MKSNAYYRTRIDRILQASQNRQLSDKYDDLRKADMKYKVNNDFDLLSYGITQGEFANLASEKNVPDDQFGFANRPLTLAELMTYNTWFLLHPEKVCGKEETTTSIHFPVRIVGNQEDVIRAIDLTLNGQNSDAEAQAKAREKKRKLALMKLKLAAAALDLEL